MTFVSIIMLSFNIVNGFPEALYVCYFVCLLSEHNDIREIVLNGSQSFECKHFFGCILLYSNLFFPSFPWTLKNFWIHRTHLRNILLLQRFWSNDTVEQNGYKRQVNEGFGSFLIFEGKFNHNSSY
ncbi:hypothetical protein CFOL_v3_07570 [Cephalotus follicularis]|uniref:Uncharacterized protein n=1 Tax=Cephalotus follicularis TaxID=3775 RepID=A0A1Q3B8E5_CEPFO|nr:hypothetical protein CFOL_v3_07570 [Cephalotus follicularis]